MDKKYLAIKVILLVATLVFIGCGQGELSENSDGNDSFSQAVSFDVDSSPYSSDFDFSYDVDYYQVVFTTNERYQIETFSTDDADTVVSIYNSSQVKVGYNDDKSLQSKVIFDCFEAGTYYIEVKEYSGNLGQYSLVVTNVEVPSVVLPQSPKKWTVLVYLDGDNSLSDYTVGDVNEMINAGGSGANVNIVLLWDRLYTMSRYYYVTTNSYAIVANPGEVNMGAPQTAIDFIDFAVSNYQADNYAWIYWNHGSGVDRSITPTRGVCWDTSAADDHLTEVEQKEIIVHLADKIGKKVAVVGYDACLMATAEHMYLNKDYADYFVASQASEPGDGWDYDFITQLKADSDMGGAELATNILNKYAAYYASDSEVTFSVAALSNLDALGTALNSFSQAITNSTISQSVFRNFSYAANVGYFESTGKDFFSYMANVAASADVTNAEIKVHAQTITNIIANKLIIAEYHGSYWDGKAHGVSITMKPDTDEYSELDLAKDTGWDEFIDWAGFF